MKLVADIHQQWMSHIDRHDGSREEHVAIDILDLCDFLPVFCRDVVAEGSLASVRLLVVLQDKRVGGSIAG